MYLVCYCQEEQYTQEATIAGRFLLVITAQIIHQLSTEFKRTLIFLNKPHDFNNICEMGKGLVPNGAIGVNTEL